MIWNIVGQVDVGLTFLGEAYFASVEVGKFPQDGPIFLSSVVLLKTG